MNSLNTNNSDQLSQEFGLSYDDIKLILTQTLNPDNDTRNKMENIILSKKYFLQLYEALFAIFSNPAEPSKIKLPAILCLKNIIRMELNSHNNKVDIHQEFKDIIGYVKTKIVELINAGFYKGSDKLHLKEIILLLADKCFPHDWEDLNSIFKMVYSLELKDLNPSNLEAVMNIQDLFFSILKQQNRKRSLTTRNRFFKVKDFYISMVTLFYEKYNQKFFESINGDSQLIDDSFFSMMVLDKTLLLLIDCSFNINELYKDQNYIKMLKASLHKAETLLKLLINGSLKPSTRDYTSKNLYALIKYLSKVQAVFPILFFNDFNQYVDLLMGCFFNIDHVSEDVIKISLHALFKVFNTQLYKDNMKEEPEISGGYEGTPVKSNSTKRFNNLKGVSLIVSPTKLKNFENEIISVTSRFNEYFSEEALNKMLDIFLSNIPKFLKAVKKPTPQEEIDYFIGETDDEISLNDGFSQNIMDGQVILRSLLRSVFETFTNFCLKYLKNKLEILYKNMQLLETNGVEVEAIINLANVIPYLYREGIVSESNMNLVDPTKLLAYIQGPAFNNNSSYLKLYIITIAKWSDVLILNESIFDYINHLLMILMASKNNIILCECCLSFKIVIANIDKHLRENKKFQVFEDKQKLQEYIKSKINWAEALKIVSKVGLNIINLSPQTLLNIVNLFTCLIEKCHYQCEAGLLETIQSSSLLQIISETNNEFGHNALIDMWKALLLLFQDNDVIINYSLVYLNICFSKELDANNLGLLLFLLRVVEEKQNNTDVKSTIAKFVNSRSLLIFKSYTQNLNNILVNIIEEIVLFEIIDSEKLGSLFELCKVRLEPALEMTNTLLQRNDSNVNANDFLFTDLCEYKSSIFSLLNTIFIKFYQEKGLKELINCYPYFLDVIFKELNNSRGKSSSIYTTMYITNLIAVLNRISVFEFDFFKANLSTFLTLNQSVTYEMIFAEWLRKMENIISSENRKINSIVVCSFLNLMSKEEFIRYFHQFCNICLFTIHSMLTSNTTQPGFEPSSTAIQEYKSFNIRFSSRKTIIIKRDSLVTKIDILSLFKETLTKTITKFGITYEDLLGLIKNRMYVKRLNDIFGKTEIPIEEVMHN